jgi:gliding motility-associated-like protein
MTYVMTTRDANSFTLDISTTIFRDAFQNGAQGNDLVGPEIDVEIAIYRGSGNVWTLVDAFIVLPDSPEQALQFQGNVCFDSTLLPRFQAGQTSYTERNVVLDVINENYLITLQRCCRREGLSNVVNSGNTGSVTSILLSPEVQILQNSSPVYDNDPEIVICNQFEQIIDVSASDPDGDDLSYSFFRPEVAGGPIGDPFTNPCPARNPDCLTGCDGLIPNPANCGPELFNTVQYFPGFNEDNAITASVPFTIDPNTGIISGTASATGVYLLGVVVEEFRDGVKIGETRRDFDVTVTVCDARPVIGPPNGNFATLERECSTTPFMVTAAQSACGETRVGVTNFTRQDSTTTPFIWRVFDTAGSEIQTNDIQWTPSFNLPEGEYSVELTIFPDDICVASCNYTLIVQESQTPSFDITEAAPCSGDPVLIQNTSIAPNGTSYVWDFGNGDGSTSQDPGQILYTSDGPFEVSLEIINGVCRDTLIQSVAYTAPVAPVNIDPSAASECVGVPITFNNSIPSDHLVEWDFGDGNTSSELVPEYSFATEGTFTVSATVTAPNGCPADATDVMVQTAVIPDNSFTISDSNVCEGDPFEVTPASTDRSLQYLWDFGDGTSSTDRIPDPIQYTIEDLYDISLIVSNGICDSDPATATVQYVLPPSAFTIQPSRFLACTPAEITFENTLTQSSVFNVSWDFGDGSNSNEISPTHTYTEGGNVTASFSLTTTTGQICREETFDLTLVDGPDAAFTPTPNPVPNPTQAVVFTNETIPPTATFEWDFGDGNDSSAENPVHTYNQPGAFTVELIARTLTGNENIATCIDTAFVEVFVESDGMPIYPNAFRPLGNANPEFKGVSVFTSFSQYELSIWDRWGQLIFTTTDFDEGWNGRKNNTGEILPQGVYVYKAEYSILSAEGASMRQPTISNTVLLLN